MYDNDFDMNQMELDPGSAGEMPGDEIREGFSPDPDGADGGDNLAEEGGEVNGPEGVEEEEAPPEKPKRTRRKKKEEDELPPEQEQQDVSDDPEDAEGPGDGLDDGGELPEGADSEDADSDDESDGDGPQEQPARNVRRQRPASMLDEYGRVVSERMNAANSSIQALTAAYRRRIILTGTVDGIESDGNLRPRVVFYVGECKVVIPFSEMGFDLNPDEVDDGEAGRRIDTMLGAKIDYMVRSVDARNKIAAASRKDAMLLRQRTILNARSGNGYRIREGMKVTARVVQVFRNVMLVEVYGYQTNIRRDSVSNVWVHDIRENVQVGDERPVVITRLVRDEQTGEVTRMEVSMKAAEEETQIELRPGNSYTATVSGFTDTAYFVKVSGVPIEVRCPIASNHILEMLDLGDSVKVVIRNVNDRGIAGSIRKLLKRAEASLI